MYENVFNRVEEKYLITQEQQEKLLKKIKHYIKEDQFFKSTICNIYFDTINNDLIIHSLDKPMFKEKVRLRSYEVPNIEDSVFLEIKEKYKGIVGKRRIKLKLQDFYDYIEHGKFSKIDQITKEIDYYFKYYHLQPAIFIGYDRISYQGKEDPGLRITFDTNLRSRREDLKLELGDAGKKYFKNNSAIMEIKTVHALPLWLIKELSALKIYPTSFSKYGSIYAQEKGELNLC